jgi:protein-S-isoprenylcysteine O-methyltransferase Ste14
MAAALAVGRLMSDASTTDRIGAGAPAPAGHPGWTVARLYTRGLPFGMRLLACLAQAIFVRAAVLAYLADSSRFTLLILIATEVASFLGLMFSRPATATDYTPAALIMVAVVYCYVVFLDGSPGIHLIPEQAGAAIQIIGLSWTVYAKFSIGRSFGLLPANRGIVVVGAYRWMRHPIYAGYLVTHIGFLAANFGLHNLVVFSVLYVVQGLRVMREEALLRRMPEYRAYVQQVRYRILPGVF